MKRFNGIFGGLLTAVALLLGSADSSQAATLGADKTLNLSGGGFTFVATDKAAPNTGYLFRSSFKPGSEMKTGAIKSVNGHDVFESVILTTTLQLSAFTYQDNTYGNVAVGNLTGTLNVGYNNVRVDLANDLAGGMEGEASGGGFLLNVNGTLDGKNVSFTAGLDQMFATIGAGDFNGFYGNLVNNFGDTFSLALGNIGNVGYANPIVGWLGGNATFAFGDGSAKNYKLNGDISGSYTEVPEPMSAALLGMGLVGGALKRRRKTA